MGDMMNPMGGGGGGMGGMMPMMGGGEKKPGAPSPVTKKQRTDQTMTPSSMMSGLMKMGSSIGSFNK